MSPVKLVPCHAEIVFVKIATEDGPRLHIGIVLGNGFALIVRSEREKRGPLWSVTHIKSGLTAAEFFAGSLERANQIVAKMGAPPEIKKPPAKGGAPISAEAAAWILKRDIVLAQEGAW